MNLVKGVSEGLKVLAILVAIAVVLWTMPEYASFIK